MVSGVQNNVAGASAYTKGSQLGSTGSRDSAANFKKEVASEPKDTGATAAIREAIKPEETQRSQAPKETEPKRDETSEAKTQLEAKNDNQTLRTEQTRGSLLDLAV